MYFVLARKDMTLGLVGILYLAFKVCRDLQTL